MFKVRNKRETGFEILRILAMFFIICWHIICHGGVDSNSLAQTKIFINFIKSLFITSVNVFVLISAYFMVKSKLNIKKVLFLFVQVLFYSLAAYLVYACFIVKDFDVKEFISCFFPISNEKYWFFSAYFVLMLLSPFLNKMLNGSTKKELYGLSVLLFVLSYLYMKTPLGYAFDLRLGYSIFWFICLYIFAGTLRLYPLQIKKYVVFAIYLVSTLLLWMFSMIPADNYFVFLIHNSLDYTSPLVTLASVSLLLLFKDINIKNIYVHNTLCYVSSLTFGVYLIHDSEYLRYAIFDLFNLSSYHSSLWVAVWVIVIALGIFVFCAMIEMVRKLVVFAFTQIRNRKNNQNITNI